MRGTTNLVIATLILLGWPLRPCADAADNIDPPQGAAQPAYGESAEGLKNFLEGLFAAVKAGDTKKSSFFFASLSVPQHETWFLKTFGATEGPRLEEEYQKRQPEFTEWFQKRIGQAVKDGRTEIAVNSIEKPEDTQMKLMQVVLGALAQPTRIYTASDSKGNGDASPFYLGEFVYVDGGFRYLDRSVLQALSMAPPMRIRVGGNVQVARIIQKVQPEYPQDARDGRIQGTVVLEVILKTDGTVQQIQVVSGHPLLVQSALDAVKQWRYQPTLLNGRPVEVDTQVNVIFSLKP